MGTGKPLPTATEVFEMAKDGNYAGVIKAFDAQTYMESPGVGKVYSSDAPDFASANERLKALVAEMGKDQTLNDLFDLMDDAQQGDALRRKLDAIEAGKLPSEMAAERLAKAPTDGGRKSRKLRKTKKTKKAKKTRKTRKGSRRA